MQGQRSANWEGTGWKGWRLITGAGAVAVLLLATVLMMRHKQSPLEQARWEEEPAGEYRVVGESARFEFDGTGNRVVVADTPRIHFGTNEDFSVTAWIRAYPLTSKIALHLQRWLSAHPGIGGHVPAWVGAWIEAQATDNDYGVTPVVDKHHTPDPLESVGFQLYLDSGRLACQLSAAPMRQLGFENFVSPGPNLQDRHWHHVAMSVTRSAADGGRLYVDDRLVLVFNPTRQNADLSNSEPVRIGNHANPKLRCRFKGQIERVAVYRRALSAQEVATEARNGR